MIGFFTAPQLAFGPGAFEQLSALGIAKSLIVLDPKAAASGSSARLEEEIVKSGGQVQQLILEPGEPSFEGISRLAPTVEKASPDWIIAVGGGSAIDTARGLWVQFENPTLPLSALSPLSEHRVRVRSRFLCVPTTNGSGSECGWSLHLRDSEGKIIELGARQLVADWVLLDPVLIQSLEPSLFAEEGVDAVAHALEAIASEWAQPFANALALAALGTLLSRLPVAARHPEDTEARAAAFIGGSLAGMAVANAQIGLVHALAHAVGPVFGLPHRRAVTALLPAVVEFNFGAARERYETLAPLLGASAVQNRLALGQRLRSFLTTLGLPLAPGFGVSPETFEAALPQLVLRTQHSAGFVGNPRVPSASEIERILRAVRDSHLVDF